MTALWLTAFGLVLVGGLATFLVLEFIALRNKDDELHTLSTYIKRARRRTRFVGSLVLSAAIWLPAIWLWGHLVLELW